MDIRYVQGDMKIGDKVTMKINNDMIGMVTGIQFRDQSITYLVTFIVNDAPVEYFCRPIEIRKILSRINKLRSDDLNG